MAFDRAGLERRTKEFALQVVRFVEDLPRGPIGDVLGRQLLRSATSIGANYREASRAESRSDFIHKISLVEKEAAETQYWIELCQEAGVGAVTDLRELLKESTELLAFFTQIGKSTKARTANIRTSNFEGENTAALGASQLRTSNFASDLTVARISKSEFRK